MDRKEYKSKPQHLVTDARNGEIVRIVHPSNTDIGSSQISADLRVSGAGYVQNLHVSGAGYVQDLRFCANSSVFGYRLSLSSSVSVPSADVPSGSFLYLAPHTSNCVGLFDINSSTWQVKQSNAVTLTLSSLTTNTNYDAFVYWNSTSAALVLELVAWSSNIARATDLITQDGILVKSGNAARRYAGTIRTVSTSAVSDKQSQRFVWNQYNRVERSLKVTEPANNWTYNTLAFRSSNSNIYNSFEYVTGNVTQLMARTLSLGACSGGNAYAGSGIGIDSTTVNSADIFGTNVNTSVSQIICEYRGQPSVGYHRITWLECGGGVANMIWYGDANQPTFYQMGMLGQITI